MLVTDIESPSFAVRSGAAPKSLDIPPPYDGHRNLSLGAEKERGGRPLPQPRAKPPALHSTPARPAPRRRASGGFFVNLEAKAAKKNGQRFYVCNRSPADLPTSPTSPNPRLGQSFPIHIVPPTPLPPPTPELVQSRTQLATLMPDPLSPEETMHPIQAVKKHRRFGGSVGSIPESVLAELRSIGEERDPWRTVMVPMWDTGKDSESDSSSDEDYGDAEDDLDEDYSSSWVMAHSTRATSREVSPKWVQELGKDRWIADRYSSLLASL
ncbi:hypothetical protein B0H17DRAFT_1202339 [Mycena rosella]|uniref:Uncharacterized protein n=1 Tax=Mycena rosella TaxID=1033263 RepID=A0AAD7DE08_MYCRO|nr:hypothetical protein B0H17DRAFT_1202339 [Mycena rosella]